MRRQTIAIVAVALICAIPTNAFKVNLGKAVKADTELTKGITLSDDDIAEMAREYIQWMDANNPVAADDYGFKFAVEHGCNPYSMRDALQRLIDTDTASIA